MGSRAVLALWSIRLDGGDEAAECEAPLVPSVPLAVHWAPEKSISPDASVSLQMPVLHIAEFRRLSKFAKLGNQKQKSRLAISSALILVNLEFAIKLWI